ncbi:Uncharacterised protein [Halioglobus japonicus]|nr:Uncharacterised protein [Halioglobus japonicus]
MFTGQAMLIGVFALLAFAGVAGGLVSWSYLSRIRQLESRVRNLQQRLDTGSHNDSANSQPARPAPAPAAHHPAQAQSVPIGPADPVSTDIVEAKQKPPGWPELALIHLQQHWMIWLGGLCVGLAGVFLVRYSIEQGLLGPGARILLALATGVILHGVAEWLRRRTREAHPAFAALSGGASITLYAAILAALRLYGLLSPSTTFALLAVIALATMALSLLHGPVLAIIGLLGAYVVPLLVSDGSGRVVIALVYSLIISGAALLLMRYVYRIWLWAGMLAGGLGWWLLSLASADADGVRGYYLAVLAYGILAVPSFNWLLRHIEVSDTPGSERRWHIARWVVQPIQLGLAAIVVAQAISIALGAVSADSLLLWSPLVIVAILGARANPTLSFLPWLTLASHWFGWLLCGLHWSGGALQLGLEVAEQTYFLQYALGTAILYSALCWWVGRGQPFAHSRFSLMTMAPLLWLALAYLLVTDLSVDWQWSLMAIALGLLYLYLARNKLLQNQAESAVWLILGGHLGYSLAVAMLFREATLTLALATQLISLTWLIRRFQLQNLDWLVKLVLAVVLLRLTFNPWLLRYPADIHWSLWTYGGSTLCAYIAMTITPSTAALRKWLAAATVQLLVLFFAAETRYWLYDGEIFRREYSLVEAAINSFLWSGLGLAYYLRAGAAQALRAIYLNAAKVLLIMAAVNQVLVLSFLNPLWGKEAVGTTPIINIISLAYGLPALMAYLVYRYYDNNYRKLSSALAAVSALMFVSLHIRHLWQGAVDIGLPTGDGELYSYSAAWLIIATAAILFAGWRQRRDLYLVGMGLLLVVVAKLFLVDMAGLEGLWRVASFMGLGLSLLALAYLYQRQIAKHTQAV